MKSEKKQNIENSIFLNTNYKTSTKFNYKQVKSKKINIHPKTNETPLLRGAGGVSI